MISSPNSLLVAAVSLNTGVGSIVLVATASLNPSVGSIVAAATAGPHSALLHHHLRHQALPHLLGRLVPVGRHEPVERQLVLAQSVDLLLDGAARDEADDLDAARLAQ